LKISPQRYGTSEANAHSGFNIVPVAPVRGGFRLHDFTCFMRRALLAAVVLFYPALTHADALSALGEAQAIGALLPFWLGGVVLLIVGTRFSITDFRTGQPRKRTARAGALGLLLGLLMALASRDLNKDGTLIPNLWTDLYVPLAWGLWAAGRARRAPHALARIRAVALVLGAALAGVGSILGLYFPKIMPSSYRPYDQHSAGLLVGLVALAGTWALLLYRYRDAIGYDKQSVSKIGQLLGLASVAGAGYVLLLRLLVDALHSWAYAMSYSYNRGIHWSWSTGWSEAALTLLLYLGSGSGLCWLQWAFYPGNAPVGDEQERPANQ
jgi:hypothetical protein